MVDAKGGNYHKQKPGREQKVQDGRCRAVVGNVPQYPRITEGLLKSEGRGGLALQCIRSRFSALLALRVAIKVEKFIAAGTRAHAREYKNKGHSRDGVIAP